MSVLVPAPNTHMAREGSVLNRRGSSPGRKEATEERGRAPARSVELVIRPSLSCSRSHNTRLQALRNLSSLGKRVAVCLTGSCQKSHEAERGAPREGKQKGEEKSTTTREGERAPAEKKGRKEKGREVEEAVSRN